MKRGNSVSWKDSPSKSDQKKTKRTLSLNSKMMSQIASKSSSVSSNAPKTRIEEILNVKADSIETNEIEANDLSDSFELDEEFFSDMFFHLTFEIKKIEKEDEYIKLLSDDLICIVKGQWMEINFYINMRISVFECPCCVKSDISSIEKIIIVDDFKNYLVIEDKILPVTSICNALKCIYSPIFKEKVMEFNFEYSHQSLSTGVIIHNVIEYCLKNNNYNLKSIVDCIRNEIKNNVKILYCCNTNEKNAMIECTRFVKEILALERYNYTACKTEDKIISRKLNIKGIIDAIIVEGGLKVPIEIKTGKVMDVQHRAQILLYNLMMKERFPDINNYGYLLYIQNGNKIKVKMIHEEIKGIAILRSKIASIYFISKFGIENNQNPFKYPEKFRPDCSCLEVENCKSVEKIFTIDGLKGEFLKEQWKAINDEEEVQSKGDYYKTFFKSQNNENLNVIYNDSEINRLGEYIEIYNSNKIKLCSGKIEKIVNNCIFIKLSEKINLYSFYEILISNARNELFYKVMRFSLLKIALHDDFFYKKETTPKNTFKGSLSSTADKYIDLISSPQNSSTPSYKCGIPDIFKEEFLKLNDDQRSALYLSLNCERYRLIHGFPGTGKSTLIALLIKILVHTGKKVLLICYTNLAIDNILNKLKIPFYRALKEKKEFETVAEMKDYFENIKLVAGTCYSFTDLIFVKRTFDFCIIDEASQQHLLLSLIPISFSQKFILVGDHLQLKPLTVKNEILKISLFEQLVKKESVCKLKTQYRMGEEIMKISNIMFYKNKMIGTNKKSKIEFINTKDDGDLKIFLNKLELNQDITILCYFNSQVTAVKKIINDKCRVETIDRFQGSENHTILLIFDPVIDCEVINSRERLNVGLTRAKQKLILIGNKEKMMKILLFKEMFVALKDNNFIN